MCACTPIPPRLSTACSACLLLLAKSLSYLAPYTLACARSPALVCACCRGAQKTRHTCFLVDGSHAYCDMFLSGIPPAPACASQVFVVQDGSPDLLVKSLETFEEESVPCVMMLPPLSSHARTHTHTRMHTHARMHARAYTRARSLHLLMSTPTVCQCRGSLAFVPLFGSAVSMSLFAFVTLLTTTELLESSHLGHDH